MFAVRNIKLCTKDCMCLFVCPTGATDTEDGQIDAEKCLDGCRLCVDACPSGAISLVYQRYPEPKKPDNEIAKHLEGFLTRRAKFIKELVNAKTETESGEVVRRAVIHSLRIAAEDYVREMGFMIPQSETINELQATGVIEDLYGEGSETISAVHKLLDESTDAIDNYTDSSAQSIQICGECGFIALGKKIETCPHCSKNTVVDI